MRILSFVIVLFFTVCINAQSNATSRSFNDGTRSAASGNFQEALESYRTALTLTDIDASRSGRNAQLHFNIGVCLYRLDRAAEAVPEFEKAIRLRNENYQKASYALGMAESALENWVKAAQAFEAAIKLKKDDGEAWFDLGMAYLNRSDLVKAEKAFRNSIKYRSIDPALGHNNIGVILAMNSNFSLAEKEFETALVLSEGKLIEAKNNLEYCKRRNPRELLAGLAFAKKPGNPM